MRITTQFSCLFVIVAALAPSSFGAQKAPHGKAAVEKQIRALDVAWVKAAAKHSADAWVAFYAPDAVVLPPNEPVADTKAKIHKSMEAFLSLPGLNVTWTCNKVVVANSLEMAYCYGSYKVSFKGPDGSTIEDHGKNVEIWKKQRDGKWKCVLDTWNTDLPAAS